MVSIIHGSIATGDKLKADDDVSSCHLESLHV